MRSTSPGRGIALRSAYLAAAAAGILIAAPRSGRCEPALTEPHKTIVFSPDRPERCDYFFVTEFNVGVTGVNSQDGVDRFLFTDALGLMRNVDRSHAVGVSIDAHLTGGAIRFVPTLRVKQWLARRSSLDLSLGYAHASLEQEGIVGPIFNVRYAPNEWFHVQAGGCRIRNVTGIFYTPDLVVQETTRFQVYGGVGLGGVPAVVSWGAQAVGMAALVLALSGMN